MQGSRAGCFFGKSDVFAFGCQGCRIVSVEIHSSAIVDPKAQLGENVEVEAFCMIGPNACIGDGSKIFHHATVEGRVVMGAGNQVHSYATIGGLTHDLKYKGGNPGLKIGDDNVFREYRHRSRGYGPCGRNHHRFQKRFSGIQSRWRMIALSETAWS